MPAVTVITAAYNRQHELRRALRSLAEQTFNDFECLVVDDASTEPLAPVVAEFDERFRYLRNPVNTGPNGARRLGMLQMAGEMLIGLDSDDQMFPWGLERAWHLLSTTPEVDAVCGMYVFPDGLRGRVRDGRRVLRPEEYVRGALTLRCDLVGAFRRGVVEEWLETDPGYFRLEFRHWLSLGTNHAQLFVDEPWARVNFDASARATHSTDERVYADVALFVRECRPLFGATPCEPLDDFLARAWLSLRIRRRPEAALLEPWMAERRVSAASMPARRVWEKMSSPFRSGVSEL